MRVLLIEDDSAVAQSIELMLKSESFNVYTTDLGEEGVDLGKLYDYDIILLDLNLPDMSGYDVLKQLRVSKIKTPILILSGLAGIEDKVKGLGFGADDKVKIERTVVKRNEGSAGLIVTTSKTDERAFKTTVRNGHDFPIKVAIQDQLPVSENDDIVVEMLPSSTPATTTNLRDRRGVLEWAFEAKPGEIKDINFAWRMRWPKDKGVVMVPAG